MDMGVFAVPLTVASLCTVSGFICLYCRKRTATLVLLGVSSGICMASMYLLAVSK